MRTQADLASRCRPVETRATKTALVISWLAALLPVTTFAAPCGESARGTTTERTFNVQIKLAAGCDYVIEAEQTNADVTLSVLDPERRVIVRVDSPMGRIGLERAVITLSRTGDYTLRTEPSSTQGSWGRIEWRVSPLPPSDRSAMRSLTQAAHLYATATASSREQAVGHYKRAIDAWRAAGSKENLARTQLELGWLQYTWMANWQEATRLADEVLAASKGPLLRTSATLLGALARLETAQTAAPAEQSAMLAQVVESLKAARRGFEHAGLRYEAVFAQNNLGLAYQYSGDPDGAIRIFMECVAQFSELKEPARVGMARQNIGWVQIESGDYVSAREQLHTALEDMRNVDDDMLRLAILNNSALVASTLGEYEEAARTYLEAHDVAARVGEKSEQARALHGLGVTYVRAGNDERALRYFRQALSMRPSGRGRIATLLALGNLLREQGDLTAALSLHEEARGLASLPLDVAKTHVALGNDHAARKNFAEALRAFDAALAARAAGTEISGIAEVGRARSLVALGQLKEALPAVTQGIDTHERNQSSVHAAEAYALRASTQRQLGRANDAKRDIDTAIRLSERVRSRLSNPDLRTTYLAARSDILQEKLQQLTAGTPGPEMAMESLLAMERWRAAGLRDRIEATPRSARQDRSRMQDALMGASYQLDQARDKRRPDQRQIAALNARIAALETALDSLEGGIAIGSNDALGSYDQAALRRLQSKLDAEHVIAYYSGDSFSWRWVVTRSEISVERLPGRAELRKRVSDALVCYATPVVRGMTDDCVRSTGQLASTLLPARSLAPDVRGITFVPDGLLSAVPFAALPARNGYVIDTQEVAVSPALSLIGDPVQGVRKERALMVVADPVYAPDDARRPSASTSPHVFDSLPRLPATAREAEAITTAWSGRTVTLQGFDARRERVLQLSADRFDILHFATHVTLNRSNPDLSRIELSRYDPQGRIASVAIGPRDLRDIKLTADLVVLSGCDSGLGLELGGEGMLGLQQSLIGAGARNVIATLWSVSDRSSLALMTDMYRQLGASPNSYRRVLRDAQLRLRRSADQSAPYYWAAFGLYSTCLRC